MKIRKTIRAYSSAVSSSKEASRRSTGSILLSLLKSRFNYKIGPHPYCLYSLSEKSSESWPDYLQDKHVKPILKTINPSNVSHLTRSKLSFYQHCLKHSLPTIPILAKLERPTSDGRDSSADKAARQSFASTLEELEGMFFFKTTDGSHGLGAFTAEHLNGAWRFGNSVCSTMDLVKHLDASQTSRGGWLVQPVIRPHNALQKLMPRGILGTLRIVTYLHQNQPRTLFAVLRIPSGTTLTDNFSAGSSGNIVAPVDLDTGAIGIARQSTSKTWPCIRAVAHHPETGTQITGVVIPYWEQIMSLVSRAQAATSEIRTVGWDIAVTDTGPLIVEANHCYDIDILQVALDRGLRKPLAPILSLASTTPLQNLAKH